MARGMRLSLSFLLLSAPAIAQTTANGSLHGVATDEAGARVPGVLVTATSSVALGPHTATTDGAGSYRIADLPPGDYIVTAELTGFAKVVQRVTMLAGLNARADLAMKVGGIGESIEVRQDASLLETRNGAQAVNLSGELVNALPLFEKREWFGALALAPGVTIADFVGDKMIYVHGSDPAGTLIQIDGADVTSAGRNGTSYLNLNTDTIRDIQVQTSGIDASTPLGNGGVINIAAASGTNQVHGTGTLYFQPRSWNDSNTPGGTSSTTDQKQLDLSLGGPLLKDRLWAFGSYRREDIRTGVNRSAQVLAMLRALVQGYEPRDSASKANFWFAKLTAQPSGRQHVEGFYQRDFNPVDAGSPTLAVLLPNVTGGSASSVRLSSVWSNRLTSRLSVAYNGKRRFVPPVDADGPTERVFDSTLRSGGRVLGSGPLITAGPPVPFRAAQPAWKVSVAGDATLLLRQERGSHELQTGAYFQPREQSSTRIYVNDGFVLEEVALRQAGDLTSGVVPFHRQFVEGAQLTSLKQRTRDTAFYVQDAWRPTSRLTLNAGVRVDHIIARDLVRGATSQHSTDIGPRFGANYALTSGARDVVRAYWVRVHDQPGIVTTAASPALATTDTYDLNADGTFETSFLTPSTAGLIANRSNDPDLHQPSVPEWGAGYGRQLRNGLTANIDFVHRRFVDRPTLVEVNGKYNGSVFAGYENGAFNEVYVATNNRWNTPVYTSLDVSVTERSARLQAIASYVRQWRHIDGTWQPHDPALFIQPAAFPNDKGIGSSTGTASGTTDANSLFGSHMTQSNTGSAQWQDHVVRLGATYSGPWALLLAANYTFSSGIWGGPIVTRTASADPAFGPATVALSNGRVVSNPLATTIRFAYPTRGDGQQRTPALHQLNVRLGRRLTLGRVRFDGSVDFFNVTNHGADQSFPTGANQTFSPLFGTTTDRQLPRSAQIALRASF